MRKLFNDEAGFIISAELCLCITIMFCGCCVGLVMIRDALVQELGDVSEMIGAVDQSYNYRSVHAEGAVPGLPGAHARCSGSGFNDDNDDCDCKGVVFSPVCGKADPSPIAGAEGTN